MKNTLGGFPNRHLRVVLTEERVSGKWHDRHKIRGLFQPTIQPTNYDVLCDFRVFWQSPRFL